ncbi:MAG TPA: hypothetical protein EYM97_01945 [Gemmatimonadetes bacterium]|nr:hypothetical protein [Gemmatimonadota bacterium]
MSKGKVRRVVIVLLSYAVGSVIVFLTASVLSRILALPELFPRALLIGLILGVPISITVAWIYPNIGLSGGAQPDEHSVNTPVSESSTEG